MGYIISDTATWVKMVRACFKKVREWLGEKCTDYEVEGVRPEGRPQKTRARL